MMIRDRELASVLLNIGWALGVLRSADNLTDPETIAKVEDAVKTLKTCCNYDLPEILGLGIDERERLKEHIDRIEKAVNIRNLRKVMEETTVLYHMLLRLLEEI